MARNCHVGESKSRILFEQEVASIRAVPYVLQRIDISNRDGKSAVRETTRMRGIIPVAAGMGKNVRPDYEDD
jgi:hypothetical protein